MNQKQQIEALQRELADLRAFVERFASFEAKEHLRLQRAAADTARFRGMTPDDVRAANDIDVRRWHGVVGVERALDLIAALPEADQFRIADIIDSGSGSGLTRRRLHVRSGGAVPKHVRLTAKVTSEGRKLIEIDRHVAKALGADSIGNPRGIAATREELVPTIGADGKPRTKLSHVHQYGGGRSAVELLREAGANVEFTYGGFWLRPWDLYSGKASWEVPTNRLIREDHLERVLTVDGGLRQMLHDEKIVVTPCGREFDVAVFLDERGPLDHYRVETPASGAW